eukprot:CAMPEP_0175171376 /NCGR_PEP_ID=MMETSP0087-20121206/30797_1 /TAXON_ID=136419 /ORGANISM="Unknown Unknown, Strain D1" /LENGTH=49 /DNA_ID=CAMNT_0016462237 /DNA_START=333 /DNA_END=482 /DNA_ORIENTATION=+
MRQCGVQAASREDGGVTALAAGFRICCTSIQEHGRHLNQAPNVQRAGDR